MTVPRSAQNDPNPCPLVEPRPYGSDRARTRAARRLQLLIRVLARPELVELSDSRDYVKTGVPTFSTAGSSAGSCNCAKSECARCSTASRVRLKIACSPAGIAATSNSAGRASASAKLANVRTRSMTCLSIEPAFARKPLPVPRIEAITLPLTGNRLRELLRDVLPNLATHDVINRRERDAVAADHD